MRENCDGWRHNFYKDCLPSTSGAVIDTTIAQKIWMQKGNCSTFYVGLLPETKISKSAASPMLKVDAMEMITTFSLLVSVHA